MMTEEQVWLVIAALGLVNLAIYGRAARGLYGIWKGNR